MIYVDILCVFNALFPIVNPICCYFGNIVAFGTNENRIKHCSHFADPSADFYTIFDKILIFFLFSYGKIYFIR